MADEPDDPGPDQPEEEKPSMDGEGASVESLEERRRGRNVRDRAEEDEGEPEVPEPPPIRGDHQLSLAGLGRRGLPVSSSISIMSKSHPLDGMIKPDEEVTLVIRVRPNKYEYTPERKGNEVVGFKHVHQLRIVEVARSGTEHGDVLLRQDPAKVAAES